MKKVLVFTILCMVLLLLVPGVVSADDNNSGAGDNSGDGDNSGNGDNSGDDVKDPTTGPTTVSQSGHTVVTYGVSAMYYLVVPNDFTLIKIMDVFLIVNFNFNSFRFIET